MQPAYTAQYFLKKMDKIPKQAFLQRRHPDGQQAHEKMSDIANYQRNANQKYYEAPPHIRQNGNH